MEDIQLDTVSVIVGFVVGIVIASLLKLHSLKSLGVKVDKIGLDLGIEGFEKENTTSGNNISITGGNIGGDFSGGDMDKSIKDSKFYNNIKQMLPRGDNAAIHVENPKKTFSAKLISSDSSFRKTLDELSIGGQDDWFPKYIDLCFSNDIIISQIKAEIEKIESLNWVVMSIVLDNIPGGLHINFNAGKKLPF
ncbi:hypothetical protein ACVF5D_004413 [Vibrio vulnificus]|nr:hypothetical protein [Vibrio vulnificus]